MLLGNGIAVMMHSFLQREGHFWQMNEASRPRSIFRRLVLSSLSLALVNFLMAFCEDEVSILLMGSVQSLFNALVLNTSHSLTSTLKACNGSVQLGFLSGALLPILTTPFTSYGPKSSLSSRLAFYAAPSSFCFLIGLLIWAYHRQVLKHLAEQTQSEQSEAPGGEGKPSKRGNIAELAEAYKTFKISQPEGDGERGEPGEHSAGPSWKIHFFLAFPAVLCWDLSDSKDFEMNHSIIFNHIQSMLIFFQWSTLCKIFSWGYQMSSYFFAGLFPKLGDAALALNAYLYMICGDMLGSLFAFIWTGATGNLELGVEVPLCQNITFVALFLLSVLSAMTALIPSMEVIVGHKSITHSLANGIGTSFAPLVFTTFFFGSFSKAGLESLCPKVKRARLAGVLLGLLAVLLCYETLLTNRTTSKMIAQSSDLLVLANANQKCIIRRYRYHPIASFSISLFLLRSRLTPHSNLRWSSTVTVHPPYVWKGRPMYKISRHWKWMDLLLSKETFQGSKFSSKTFEALCLMLPLWWNLQGASCRPKPAASAAFSLQPVSQKMLRVSHVKDRPGIFSFFA